MANQLSKSTIASLGVIRPWHVTQSIDAFTGVEAYDITLSGSLTVTGSVFIDGLSSGSPSNVLTYDSSSGQLYYTASSAIGGGGALTSPILTNITVGNLSAGTNLSIGTTFEDIFNQMFVTYIPPTLSSLVMRNGGSTISTADRDVNSPFTINSASFSATADNPTGIFPLSSSWSVSGQDSSISSFYFGNNVLSTSNQFGVGGNYTINRATTSGGVTFTVTGKRSDNLTNISTSTSVSFLWRNYLAASSTIPTNITTAQTVVNAAVQSILDTDKAWTATCTSANNTVGNFTYIIYPSSYGVLSGIIQNGALPVLTAFTDLGTFTITNSFGASIVVRIYKSNSDAAFANGTTLVIT